MKISFIYGPWCLGGRKIDLPNVWTSDRGLTGSELSCLCFSREMARRGHEVTLYLDQADPMIWEGVRVLPASLIHTIDSSNDVVYSWNEPDLLREVPSSVLRMVNEQVNDFDYCRPGYDDFVDIYTSPSNSHRDFIRNMTGSPDKWHVIPNGCDPDQYSDGPRQEGSVIWASSPDRGLHLLLQCWPKIKSAVPNATLKIFYNMDSWLQRFDGAVHSYPDFREFSYRASYISLALRRMTDMGIEKYGSISRKRMIEEMSKAQVLAYCCDTIRFTEGFSVTTMEACAAGVVPIIVGVDSLCQIYGDHLPMVKSPATDHLIEFSELVIKSLTDKDFQKIVTTKAKQLAYSHKWSILAAGLEDLMRSKLKK